MVVVIMAPIIPIPLHAVSPQVRAENHPVTGCKLSPRTAVSCMASSSSSMPEGAQHNSNPPPKLEPFSRSRISRLMREPSLLEKAEHALSERCTMLEGEDAYKCWEALFEFEDIKEAYKVECDKASTAERPTACRPLERFENLVRQSGGVSGLIDNVRMVARNAKLHQQQVEALKRAEVPKIVFPEDGGLPRTAEQSGEQADDESGLLPESTITRMLRHRSHAPAWFTHPPDHATD